MKFSSSDRKCEKAFNEYLKDKMSRAKSAFKELLQETKKITDKSLSMVKEKDSGHMSEIIELLTKDKRYLDLESVEGKVNRELEDLSVSTLGQKYRRFHEVLYFMLFFRRKKQHINIVP